MSSNPKKTIFVTVGTTKFEQLINKVLEHEVLDKFAHFNFTRLILQVGNGKHDDQNLDFSQQQQVQFQKNRIQVFAYQYKSSIREDLTSADLVISHAGAGSVLESLEANKKLIVVVNEDLMDNHQLELAEKMYTEGFLLYTNCQGLAEKINQINSTESSLLKKYVPGNSLLFGNYLNQIFL